MNDRSIGKSVTSMSKTEQFLQEIISVLDNPLHKRLIQKYKEENPVISMGNELGCILEEVINSEDR